MTDFLSGGDKFIIMCDVEKLAKKYTEELAVKGGLTFAAGIVGYKMSKKFWRDAKDAGFQKEADGRWIGFTKSYNGEEGYAEEAYSKALNEYKEKLPGTFIQNVFLYYYLT